MLSMTLGHQLPTFVKLTRSYVSLSFNLKTKKQTSTDFTLPPSTAAPPHGMADVLAGGLLSYGTV